MTPPLSKRELVAVIEYRARAMRREVFRRWGAALWAALTGSRTERERYLSRATDQHDLARRLQVWDEEERRRGLVNMLSFPP